MPSMTQVCLVTAEARRGALLAVRRGTDGRSLVTLTRYKAANVENEYSGAELAV